MKKSRFIWIPAFLSIIFLSVPGLVIGGQDKVTVCHITGAFNFGNGDVPVGYPIDIAEPAYPTHIQHGDPEAFVVITGADNHEYCTAGSGGPVITE